MLKQLKKKTKYVMNDVIVSGGITTTTDRTLKIYHDYFYIV